MNINRRSLLLGSLAAGALVTAGCSFDKGTSGSGNASAGASGGGSTEVLIAGWGGTTWTRNFNLFSPTATTITPGTAFFYEPLVRLDRTKAGTVLPYLAEKWEFNSDGKELTFSLRQDVTWNDGKPFTAKDVAFTWQLVLDKKTNSRYPFKAVSAVDDYTITVTYDSPAYADLVPFATRSILPEHIWKSQNPSTFTNESPVGTGPFVLDAFSPQQVSLKMRDDYWGGKSKGVQTVKIKAMSPDAAKDALKKGNIDYGTMGWESADEEYIAIDPETHVYNFYPTGTAAGLVFNCMHAPYDDPAVRRALRASVDLEAAANAVQVGYGVPTKAGLDPNVYKDVLAPDQEQKQDVELAKKELADAGWQVVDGKLSKDGKTYQLRYDVYQPYTEWVLTGQILADQWKKALGLVVGINQLADQPYSQLVESGDYGMLSAAPTGGSQISDVVTQYDSTKVTEPGKGKNFGNMSFYKNPTIDELGKKLLAIAPGDKLDEVKALAQQAQQILTDDCPFIATATAGWKAVLNTTRWTGWPEMGKTTFVPNNTLTVDACLTLLNLVSR